ncbi:MAG: ribosome silencing factor [Candidatus Caldatribacteriaceae bacterium]
MEIKKAVEDKKAFDVVVLDLKGLFPFSDYWIICSGSSLIQTKVIAEEIVRRTKAEKIYPLHVEGEETGEWILIDYGNVMVHVFREEERIFYQLEKLWRQARLVYSEKEHLDLLDEVS